MIDLTNKDINDPFVAGQFVGMLVILSYIEDNNGINKDFLQNLKRLCAEKSSEGLDKPVEDILLMAQQTLEKIQ